MILNKSHSYLNYIHFQNGCDITTFRPKKKKLFDWRNPTDPIFTADPKYFYFFVCKKKIF